MPELDWHLAFGNWRWPLSGLVVYHLLPLPEALGQTNLYITDRLSVDIFNGKVQLRPITARLSVFRSPSRLQDEVFILYTEVDYLSTNTEYSIIIKFFISLYINFVFTIFYRHHAVFYQKQFKIGFHIQPFQLLQNYNTLY